MFKRWLFPLFFTLFLTGCAIPRFVDSTVQSFSTLQSLPAAPTYRLAELPSQQAAPQAFAALAPLAHAALERAGLRRDDAAPRYIAEIGVRSSTARASGPWYADSPWGGGWGFGYGFGHHGLRAGAMLRDLPPLLYRHEVSLVLRDAATQQTVYETSAMNEDVWTDTPAVFGVLFGAALAGFPVPPQGPRQVRLPLPTQP